MPKSELFDATFILLGETEKAIKVTEDGVTDHWLPKSQIEWEESQPAGSVSVTMPLWLAQEKKFAGA